MNDGAEVRFARLERAPAYKIVSDAILKDIIGGRLQIGNRLPSEQKTCPTVRRQPIDRARGYSAPGGDRCASAGIRQAPRCKSPLLR